MCGGCNLQQLGGIGEEFAGPHRVYLDLRRRLHVDLGVDLAGDRFSRLAPAREWSDTITRLDLVNSIVVGGTVGLGAANDPDIWRGGLKPLDAIR
jgi:hypothetical protein